MNKNIKYSMSHANLWRTIAFAGLFFGGAVFGAEQHSTEDEEFKLFTELTEENFDQLVTHNAEYEEEVKDFIKTEFGRVLRSRKSQESPDYELKHAELLKNLSLLRHRAGPYGKSIGFKRTLNSIKKENEARCNNFLNSIMLFLYKTIFITRHAKIINDFDVKVNFSINNRELINNLVDKLAISKEVISDEDLRVFIELKKIFSSIVLKDFPEDFPSELADLYRLKAYYDDSFSKRPTHLAVKIMGKFFQLIVNVISATNLNFIKDVAKIDLLKNTLSIFFDSSLSGLSEDFKNVLFYIDDSFDCSMAYCDQLQDHIPTFLSLYKSFYDYGCENGITSEIIVDEIPYVFGKDPFARLKTRKEAEFKEFSVDELLTELEDLDEVDEQITTKKTKKKKKNKTLLMPNSLSEDQIAGPSHDSLPRAVSDKKEKESIALELKDQFSSHKFLSIMHDKRVNDWFVDQKRALEEQGYSGRGKGILFREKLLKKFGEESIVFNHRFPKIIDSFVLNNEKVKPKQQDDGSFIAKVSGYYNDQRGLRHFGIFEIAYSLKEAVSGKKTKQKLVQRNIFHRFFRPVEKFSQLFSDAQELQSTEDDLEAFEVHAAVSDDQAWTIDREQEGWVAQLENESKGFIFVTHPEKSFNYVLLP